MFIVGILKYIFLIIYDNKTWGCFQPQAQIEAQKATQEFQRAVEILRAAKETIALAEERLQEEESRQFDSAWQEMLNHATHRVGVLSSVRFLNFQNCTFHRFVMVTL